MKTSLIVALMLAFTSAPHALTTTNQASTVATTAQPTKLKFENLHKADNIVWGFDFLSPTELIYTERSGAMYRWNLSTKERSRIGGVPKVWTKGQGGLLDVRVDPVDPSRVYFSYSEEIPKKGGATALGTGRIQGNELTEFKRLFVSNTPTSTGQHFGSRIEFDSPTTLLMSIGDRGEREDVQNPKSHSGKVLRLNRDGSIPKDNPFVGDSTYAPEVFSLGHRSPQGLSKRSDGLLVLSEMGPRGGDEINIVEAKKNYGWPIVTFGREYWGPRIGEGTAKAGLESPVHQWTPSISPSGIAWVENSAPFNAWKGSLLVGCLSGQQLRRLEFARKNNPWIVTRDEMHLNDLKLRIRNLRFGPDGALYLSTDSGIIGKATPEQK